MTDLDHDRARSAAAAGARAYHAAASAPGAIATLILQADAAWGPAAGPAAPIPPTPATPVPEEAVRRVADALRAAASPALLLRGPALWGTGLEAAGRIAAGARARLFCDTFAPRLESGAGAVSVARLPYFAERVVETLKDVDLLVLVGASPPVAFFGKPDAPSWLAPEGCAALTLAHPHEDAPAALSALAETLGAALARALPENAVLVDEMLTSGPEIPPRLRRAPRHDHLSLTGGVIGSGLPMALGAALAAPERKIVCVHGDGGAMYSAQALWSMAREQADVLVVILANGGYRILEIELERHHLKTGPETAALLDLGAPAIDWTAIARGMGVAADRAETAEALSERLEAAMARPGPRLIEAVF